MVHRLARSLHSATNMGFPAGTFMAVDFARAIGRYYEITPLLVPMNQNFSVALNWPAAVAVATTGRIGVILDGFYYRQSQ